MTRRKLSVSALTMLLLGALTFAPLLSAADKDLDKNTIMFISTDNWSAARQAMNGSDFGAFLADPEIKAIGGRLQDGFMNFVKNQIKKDGGAAAEGEMQNFDKVAGVLSAYWDALQEKVTGRMAFSFGYHQDESGLIQPEMMLHFQGGEELGTHHDNILNMITELAGSEVKRAAFEMASVSFKGIDFPPEPPSPPMKAPEGLYFGHKGNDYFVGLSKKPLELYINSATATGDTAVGGRLGDDGLYKKAVGAVKSGQMNSFVNLQPIWSLVNTFLPGMAGAGGEAATAKAVLDASGLMNLGVIYAGGTATPLGARSSGFISVSGRTGFFSLMPANNAQTTMPKFVPSTVINASANTARIERLFDVIMDVAAAVGGEPVKQQINAMIAPAEAEIGMKIKDLLANLEGSLVYYTPKPSAASQSGGMGMGMGMMPGAGDMLMAMKLKDSALFQKLLDTLTTHEAIGTMIKTEEFMSRKVYTLNIAGDTPPEFAAPGMPTPSMALDGDWFMIGMNTDNIKEALRTADGEDAGRLAGNPAYQKAIASLGGAGCGISYDDTGQSISQALDTLRPMLGFLPMMVPDLGQQPDLLFLFNASNLPSSEVIQKYFGKVFTSTRVSDAGMHIESWTPKTVKAAAAKPK